MLTASTRFEHPSCTLFASAALVGDVAVHGIERMGLQYDSRLAPAAATAPTQRTVLYIVTEGVFWPDSDERPTMGPSVWLVSQDDLEGASRTRRRSLFTGGDRFSSVTLSVSRSVLEHSWGTPPLRLAHEEELIDVAREYLALVRSGDARRPIVLHRLLQVVHRDHGIAHEATARPASRSARRLWSALGTFYDRFELNPSLAQLGALAELSERQSNRLVRDWLVRFGLPSESWRALTLRWRLKAAVLLLSSQGLTVSEVAAAVGYSSAEALAAALRAERLRSPRAIRELFATGTRPVISERDLSRGEEP